MLDWTKGVTLARVGMTQDPQNIGRAQSAIVIPCYNEEKRLQIPLFLTFLRQCPDMHFVFVNDGSTDGTEQMLHAFCSAHPEQSSLLSLSKNAGKAEAVRQGLQLAVQQMSAFVGYWDADLSTTLECIPEFLRVLNDHPAVELVSGSRVRLYQHRIERSMVRHYAGRIIATLIGFLFHLCMYDTQCGAKIFRSTPHLSAVLRDSFRSRWFFDLEIILRLQIEKGEKASSGSMFIFEVPLRSWTHHSGSKLRMRDFARVSLELIRVFVDWKKRLVRGNVPVS